MLIKRLASAAFAIAFLMGIVLFTGYGRQYISLPNARIVFMISGAIALALNLFSFQSSKHNPVFSFFYWAGSIILFTGLVFQLMVWPYSQYIVFTGLGITGISFFLTPEMIESKDDDSEILDSP
tara:strand:+ start:5246 stop:5617 length:372 start_codon:yes stop_codon:yes gene_type:complete